MYQLLTLASALLVSILASAQCTFTPTITPPDPVMCPGETVVLTTQAYDSYQWYKDGQPISGAQGQTHTVDYFSDSGSSFSVLAEEQACFEMSAQVLVDGWVFLPPFVLHEGDEAISVGPFGEPTYCEGALVQLTLGMPYTENIQWTNNGVPIPGADQPTLVVTEAGSYSVSGAPAVCPNSIAQLGLTVDVDFMAPIQPQIVAADEQICAYPAGEFYQWYFNGQALINSNSACIIAEQAGAYSVYVDYDPDCQVISEPYLSTGMPEGTAQRPWTLYPSPSSGWITVAWTGSLAPGTYWSVTDRTGRALRSGFMPLEGPLQVDLSDLAKGTYLFQAALQHKALGTATRFTLVR